MTVPIIHVDTFVDKGLRGNAAAVCILSGPVESSWMQSIAHKMNMSETAFFYRKSDSFNLRWFSPLVEVDLPTPRLQGEWIELDFPSLRQHETASPLELREALGVPMKYVGTDGDDYLVELDSEDAVRTLRPNVSLLSHIQARAIIVTSQASSSKYDFVSRVFAPRLGIDEDLVTGSAHGCLGPFWMPSSGRKN